MPEFVKIFGERNTATNALRGLLARVSDAHWLPSTADEIDGDAFRKVPNHGRQQREQEIDAIFAKAGERSSWKHCATSFENAAPFADCLVLFTVRHPASWLAGLFANPYHALSPLPATIAEFLRFDWQTVARERLNGKSFTPLKLYDAKVRSYASFSAKLERSGIPFRFVRFEDVVLAQEQVFRTVAADFGKPDATFEPLLQSTKDSSRRLADYQEYYCDERWREALAGCEEAINREVDWASVVRFGYSPL